MPNFDYLLKGCKPKKKKPADSAIKSLDMPMAGKKKRKLTPEEMQAMHDQMDREDDAEDAGEDPSMEDTSEDKDKKKKTKKMLNFSSILKKPKKPMVDTRGDEGPGQSEADEEARKKRKPSKKSFEEILKVGNPYHEPKGSPRAGQFASKPGGAGAASDEPVSMGYGWDGGTGKPGKTYPIPTPPKEMLASSTDAKLVSSGVNYMLRDNNLQQGSQDTTLGKVRSFHKDIQDAGFKFDQAYDRDAAPGDAWFDHPSGVSISTEVSGDLNREKDTDKVTFAIKVRSGTNS